jgi:hypothetical protein
MIPVSHFTGQDLITILTVILPDLEHGGTTEKNT